MSPVEKFKQSNAKQEEIKNICRSVSHEYKTGRVVENSVIRKDQEYSIMQDIKGGTPVLIRGNWRIGKTSMLFALRNNHFKPENTIYISLEGEDQKKPLEEFEKTLCFFEAVDCIAERDDEQMDTYEVEEKIEESKDSPLVFLNKYLAEKGEHVFLAIDEIINFEDHEDKMKHVANLKKLSNVHLAIVLHHLAPYEKKFEEIFSDYKTHYIKQISPEEVKKLIQNPLRDTQITVADDAIQRVVEITGGRPIEINIICNEMLRGYPKEAYEKEDVDQIAGPLSEIWFSYPVINDTYKRIYAKAMNDEERTIIRQLAHEGEKPLSEYNADVMQSLIDTTAVVKDDEKGVYRINGEHFKRYITDTTSQA